MALRDWSLLGTAVVGLVSCARPSEPPPMRPTAADEPVVSPCHVDTPEVLAACVQHERIVADVERVARMRPPGSVHWARVQSLCAEVFEDSGFTVSLHEFGGRAPGVNVIGVRRGVSEPEARVVVGAHYDHIPGCQGADDNATGVAAVLEVARVLGPAPTARTVVVACWDQEEVGLVGSRAWVAGPMHDAPLPRVYFNFDGIGYTDSRPGSQAIPTGFGVLFPAAVKRLHERQLRGDFIAVVSDTAGEPFARTIGQHAERLGLPAAVLTVPDLVRQSHLVVDLQRSDHAPFWDAGVPAVMLADTANFRSPSYHCLGAPDSVDTLDFAFTTQVVTATLFAVATAAGAEDAATPPPGQL